MDKPLKIAIYSGTIPSTTFIERLINGLSNQEWNVVLFGIHTQAVTYPKCISLIGYRSNRFSKALHLLKYSFLLVLFNYKKKRILDRILTSQKRNTWNDKLKSYSVLYHKPDVFHVQWAKGLDDWMWVQDFGMKLVLSLRGAHINYSPIADEKLADMYRKNFPKVDAFHAVSEAIGLEAEKYGALKEKISVVYSGLPLDNAITTAKTENKIFQIISVGRPHWKKGYVYALDACKALKDRGFKFHYSIVGGTHEIEYAFQVHDLKLTHEISLLHKLPYANVQELIAKSDLLLLPSVEEGIANVVLEAMLNKTLVLTTDCGGMAEVIEDSQNGFIVPIRKSEAMANKILKIAELQALEKEDILQKAIQTISEKHSEQQMVDAMLLLYKNICN